MAPRKRSSDGEAAEAEVVLARVTRSSSRRLNEGTVAPRLPEVKKRNSKKAKTGSGSGEEKAEAEEKAEVVEEAAKAKTIVIEHCKQCNSFKTRATQVKNGLESGVPGINVLVNPEKPRRGCFEIREEGGEKFITLLDMPRPFKPMKELDMDEVISDIIAKIK